MGTHSKHNFGYSSPSPKKEKRDMRALTQAAERATRDFFKLSLYKYLIEQGEISDIITDVPKELDLKGVDVILVDKNGNKKYVDEKGQFLYLNDPRKTWSFEITYDNRNGDRVDGYFLQCEPGHPDHHLTDYFSLSYIDNVDANKLEDYSADKIKQVTTLFVKVSDIIEWLESKGKTFDDLYYDSEDAREIYDERKTAAYASGQYGNLENLRRVEDPNAAYANPRGYDDAYFYISDGKQDVNTNPACLIIKRNVLESLPHSREFISTPDVVIERRLHEPEKYNVQTLREEAAQKATPFKTESLHDKDEIDR